MGAMLIDIVYLRIVVYIILHKRYVDFPPRAGVRRTPSVC